MSGLFFVKITDYRIKKESYYVNCNEIKSFSCFRRENKLIYFVELLTEKYMTCLHRIRKSDYERLKKL